MRKRTKSREIALKVLYAWEISGDILKETRDKFFESSDKEDDAIVEFADALIFGVESNLEKLDKIITKHATNWRIDRMATIDKNILRFATYELLFMADIPLKVSINEAIEMAKMYGDKDSGKFVNGVLDNIKKIEVGDEREDG